MKRHYIHGTYIWQRPDWPAFRWDMEELTAPMFELVHLHGQLVGRMAMLGLGDKSNAHLQALTDELTNECCAIAAKGGVARIISLWKMSLPRLKTVGVDSYPPQCGKRRQGAFLT